jgi:hypothetical protein
MADRNFDFGKMQTDTGVKNAFRIECYSCGAVDHMVQTGGTRMPPLAAAQRFRSRGWIVGSNPRKDRCPACVEKSKREKPKVVNRDRSTPSLHDTPKADAPREMTRSDRRIINDKLDEVYGESSYKPPWTDAAVARDLGVPKAWVSAVRDEFFGEAGDNPDLDAFNKASGEITGRMASIEAKQKQLADEIAEVREKVGHIELLRRRIDRELGR